MKNLIIIILVIIVIGLGMYLLIQNSSDNDVNLTKDNGIATSTIETKQEDKSRTIIGASVEKREIIAYHFGTGNTELLFVGGIHGGYSWNTALIAYELMDYLEKASSTIPANVRVTIIPVLNPDGLAKVTASTTARFSPPDISLDSALLASARFNGRNVDLNRNFDCDWQSSGTWQNKAVSGGSEVFSEPESRAIKNYVETNKLAAVVVFYSAAGGVYASNCHNSISAETRALTKTYADASGYKAYEDFDFYEITGDMVNWLAKNNIPAISVLLSNHKDTEWTKNKAGIDALIKYYAN